MNFEQELQTYGLTDKEARLYVAALRIGSATITELVRHTSLKRATAYLIIEELIKRGLMRRITLGKRVYYAPEHPRVLAAHLEEKRFALEKLLPALSSLMENQSARPQVVVLEGHEGIKQIYREAREYTDILYWSDIEQVGKVLGAELQAELEYQEKHGISAREMVSDSAFGRRYARAQNKKRPRYETRVFKKRVFANDNMLYGDTLVIFSIREGNLFAVKIVSKEIAASYRAIFEALWMDVL